MASKDSVVFYQGQIEICRKYFSAEQFGRLMGALFSFNNGEDPEVDDDIAIAFEFMTLQMKIDRKKYDETCKKNRENGKKGGRPKKDEEKPKKANGFFENPNDKIMIREDNDKIMIREDNESVPDESSSPSIIIKYLNSKTGADYNLSTTESVELINDLIESGYDIDDLKKVVDKKCAEWLEDKTMRSYLRPSTLFGPKFAEYLAAPEPMKSEAERVKADQKNRLESNLELDRMELEQINNELEQDGSNWDLIDRKEYLDNRIRQFTKQLEAI